MSLWQVEGSAPIKAPPRSFIEKFVGRIETGLLPGSRSRNRYRVTQQSGDALSFRAEDWWTAIAVGLNDVQLTGDPGGVVRYSIQYPRWSAYVLILGAVLGIVFVVMMFTLPVTKQTAAIALPIALFWAFVWPWILIAIHRRPLRRTMERVIAEVDAA